MIPAGYKDALITYAEAKGSAGVQAISDEFDALFAEINLKRGQTLTSSTVNGKSFGWEQPITVEEKFAVFGEALREINGDKIVATYPSFAGLQR